MKEVRVLKVIMKQLLRKFISKEITKAEYNLQFQKELGKAVLASGLTREEFLTLYLALGLVKV